MRTAFARLCALFALIALVIAPVQAAAGIQVKDASGTTQTLFTFDYSGAKYYGHVAYGLDGTSTPRPLCLDSSGYFCALPLPTGAATAANQGSQLTQETASATALGAPGDSAWSGSGSGSIVAIEKYYAAKAEAIRALLAASTSTDGVTVTTTSQNTLNGVIYDFDTFTVPGAKSLIIWPTVGTGSSGISLEEGLDDTHWVNNNQVVALNGQSQTLPVGIISAGVAAYTPYCVPIHARYQRAQLYVSTGNTISMVATARATSCPQGSTYTFGQQQLIPGATGAMSLTSLVAANSNNATNVKASAGTVYTLSASNNSATVAYVKLYNKASAPTCGTDTPVARYMIPANGTVHVSNDIGWAFGTGIGFCMVTGVADNDNTAVAATTYTLNLGYK